MGNGALRNKPCWCGSGRKYKDCHLRREEDKEVNPWDIENRMRKSFSSKKCLAPNDWHNECSGKIIKAHTVPKSISLSRIAREGKVYTYKPSFAELNKTNGLLPPQLIGINNASTFTGFCSKHDDAIFAPLEKQEFIGSPEQCFLLAYRAVSRELYTKKSQTDMMPMLKEIDRGKKLIDQLAIQSFLANNESGAQAALSEMQEIKAAFDTILLSSNFESVRAYIIELEEAPNVMCSGSFYPEQDFNGKNIQKLDDLKTRPSLLTINSFGHNSGGAIVFTWLSIDEPICHDFIKTLEYILDDHLSNAVTRLMFEHIENLFISPDWWESLSDVQRKTLNRIMNPLTNLLYPKMLGCLKFDEKEIAPWAIRSRRRIN